MASKQTFPDEIMTEILLKLPVKSILRCKTLSKHHYSLIHSQFFIRRHLSISRSNEKFSNRLILKTEGGYVHLFDPIGGDMKVLEPPFPFVGEEIHIYGPVEGLYWVWVDGVLNSGSSGNNFAIWNPSTGDHLFIVPPVTGLFQKDVGMLMTLCCGRGFGYDPTTNDYKLVLAYNSLFNKVHTTSFHIFSVSKREWRCITEDEEECFGVDSTKLTSINGFFFRGSCHWVYMPFDPASGYKILAFDISTELFKFMQLPSVRDGIIFPYELSIDTFKGCLALVVAQCENSLEEGFPSFDVWVMLDSSGDDESWTFWYRVSVPPGIYFVGLVGDRFYVSEEEHSLLVSYDLESKEKECYEILDSRLRLCGMLPYEESLVRIVN